MYYCLWEGEKPDVYIDPKSILSSPLGPTVHRIMHGIVHRTSNIRDITLDWLREVLYSESILIEKNGLINFFYNFHTWNVQIICKPLLFVNATNTVLLCYIKPNDIAK